MNNSLFLKKNGKLPTKYLFIVLSLLMLPLYFCSNPASPAKTTPETKILKQSEIDLVDTLSGQKSLVCINYFDSTGTYTHSTFGAGSPAVRHYENLPIDYPTPTKNSYDSAVSQPESSYSLPLKNDSNITSDSQRVVVFRDVIVIDTASFIDSVIIKSDCSVLSIIDTMLFIDVIYYYLPKYMDADSIIAGKRCTIKSTIQKWYFKAGKISRVIKYGEDYSHTYQQTDYTYDEFGSVVKEVVASFDYLTAPPTVRSRTVYETVNTYW